MIRHLLTTALIGCGASSTPGPTEPGPTDPPRPCATLDPLVLDFGEARVDGEPVERGLTVDNQCDEAVRLIDVSLDDQPFEVLDLPALPLEIPPDDEQRITVRAVPRSWGPIVGTLRVDSDHPEASGEIELRAVGVCVSAAADVDGDGDGLPDGCDPCPLGDNDLDLDGDGVAYACDVCVGGDDAWDRDGDGVPDACDVCVGGDDGADSDGDGVPDGCDACAASDDRADEDGDAVADGCDACPGFDDWIDTDRDGVPGDGSPGSCDRFEGIDDRIDLDLDGVPDAVDQCPGFPDHVDRDLDSVADGCDACPGSDDRLDADGDTVPDGCDACEGFDDRLDADGDLVPDGCDICERGDDAADGDADGVPDACDVCPAVVNVDLDGNCVPDCMQVPPFWPGAVDSDGDGTPDEVDRCEGHDDCLNADGDFVPDACDACPGGDDRVDFDGDGVPDVCDVCDGGDDAADADGDGAPDSCDLCPGHPDDADDADGDGIADLCDACPGSDDLADDDGDGVPDGCDVCPGFGDAIDLDGDGIPGDGSAGSCDRCEGFDDALDSDLDGAPDACDACPGSDDGYDLDRDTVPDGCDVCPGGSDVRDADGDGVPDGCDVCPGSDDAADVDADGVPDGCDTCAGFDDAEDVDRDGRPDGCDACVGQRRIDALPPVRRVRVDYLFVLDDGPGMTDAQERLVGLLERFVPAASLGLYDWQIGVLTSSGLRGPVVRHDDPDPMRRLAEQVRAGEDGASQLGLLDFALGATQPGAEAGPGSDFLRLDAILSVVFVSGRSDAGSVTPQQAYAYWLGLKGNDPGRVAIGGLLPAPPGRLHDTVGLATGRWFDVGMRDYGLALGLLVAHRARLELEGVPVPATLSVRVDGVPTNDWFWDGCSGGIGLSPLPPDGSLVTAEYVEDCGGAVGSCSDGIDNDGDGLVDFPEEPGCRSACDASEVDPVEPPACSGPDGYPADPECWSAADVSASCRVRSADVFGYQMCEEVERAFGACPDLSTGQPLGLSDGTARVPVGFAFDLYGVAFDEVFVGANGTLTFEVDASPADGECIVADGLGRAIFAWWDDLRAVDGHVWARTLGVAPRRRLAVQWRVPHAAGGTIDVRAVLHEGTYDVDLCYVDTMAGPGAYNGATATAGIQRGPGAGLQRSCGEGALRSGSVVRFLHPYGR